MNRFMVCAHNLALRFENVGRGLRTPPSCAGVARSNAMGRWIFQVLRRGLETPPYIRLSRGAAAAAIGLCCAGFVHAAPASTADSASISAALTPTGGRITVEAQGVERPVPVFFTAHAEHVLQVSDARIAGEAKLSLRIVQGRPEVLTLGVSEGAEITAVNGNGLRDWSVRQGSGATAQKRFLDLRFNAPTAQSPAPTSFELTVRLQHPSVSLPGKAGMPLLMAGDAVAFDWHAQFVPDSSVELQLMHATGAVAVERLNSDRTLEFVGQGDGAIEFSLIERGAAAAEAQFTSAALTGRVNEDAHSVTLHLRAQARVEKSGARLAFLLGSAALSTQTAGDGWRVELAGIGVDPRYDLIFERKGVVPVELDFVAPIKEDGDWRRMSFRLNGGAVVPIALSGVSEGVEFDGDAPLVLARTGAEWRGFLPANGRAWLAWKGTRDKTEGALFFSSTEQSDVRVAAGLLRQTSQLAFRVLQGKLDVVRVRVDGPGEIVGVEGTNLLGWTIAPGDGSRIIEVRLSRPFETEGVLTIRSQAVLGGFPVQAEAVRLTPEGGVRHAGFVRIASTGAVRLEVTEVAGMLQLGPEQYPGPAVEKDVRQVFVYRFPAAARTFRVLANQILPEVGVAEVVTYELGEADRVIQADLELDVREAPLRDWTFTMPGDYAVATLQGADVSDYTVVTPAGDGTRAVKVFFAKPIVGRELVRVRLEKNQAAAAGEWRLPMLGFPGAKAVRGHLGIVSVPGYRIVPATLERLVDVPLTFFPKQTTGLQQAYRLREANWSAALRIEALGQSVQADVFHLYSLKEGAVYASVLINYFVIGAPANEWRIEVPATAGNIDITGQGVRREWRREGNVVVIALHQPVLGAATVLVTFEQPMSARGGAIHPGEVRPLGVQAERGYLQVVSPLQVKTELRKADGNLLKLEALELPTEFRLFATAPSLAVYQYTARPFAFELNVNWYRASETVDQVVDFAKYSSQVARDGPVMTEARLFVKTRGRKVLRFQLPPGVKLWEALVDNERVTARADGDWTLVPLSARLNPNEPVGLLLRLGQSAGISAQHVTLAAPKMAIPLVIGEWTVKSDAERLLVPRGGTAEVTQPNLTERGFEWLGAHANSTVVVLLLLVVLAAGARRMSSPIGTMLTLVAGGAALFLALRLVIDAWGLRRVNRLDVTYAATVVPADGSMTIELANLPGWQAMLSPWGVVAVVAGIVGIDVLTRVRGRELGAPRWAVALGAMLVGGGLLAQRGGATLFFIGVAAAIGWCVLVPATLAARSWLVAGRKQRGDADATGATSTVVPLLAFGLALGGAAFAPNRLRAEETPLSAGQSTALQTVVQRWNIHDDRLFAEADVTLRGTVGDSFLLLNAPAILTDFVGDGSHVTKLERDGTTRYYLVPDRAGALSGRMKFELPVGNVLKGVPILTGPAAMQRITIDLDQAGWEFTSPMAAEVQRTSGIAAGHSGAALVLGLDGTAVVNFAPKQRDVRAETTRFHAEVANVFVPGPGVVNAYARVTIRPVQGRVSSVDLRVPEGFSVGDVARGPVGAWRFDPQKRTLHVAVEPAKAEAFTFVVELQQGTAPLPFDLTLRPLRVLGAAGEVGALALAFGSDAQPERVRATGLSPIAVEDFDRDLLPRSRTGQVLATLQNAYRYNADEPGLAVHVAPVAPEVRVTTHQVLSLGDDRVVLAADLGVAITRVGIFQLSFPLPTGLELESLSGAALNHWTEADESGQRIVTLHLNGRTIGEQTFALTLVGPIATTVTTWQVPQVRLREATRQMGELQVVPERGVRLRALERRNVLELDPRSIGNARPGALAFRLLEVDWSLSLALETLEPWMTVQALEEVTAREGQTLTRLALRYRIENAAVKVLRLRLPGLTDDQAKTVRATGPAVSDLVPVAGADGHWEVRLQRGVIGETTVQIEFQGAGVGSDGRLAVVTPLFEGSRQVTQYVAVRSAGRLEVEALELPRGWQRVDWPAVPVGLQDRGDRSVPALAFRVAEPEAPLSVVVRRHDVADALKLRVTGGELTTLFSPRGQTLTAAELQLEVAEKSTLRVRLPAGARLFNTFMNGESVSVVREADAYLFHVAASTTADRTAKVRMVYAVIAPQRGDIELVGPRLSVPLENVTWRVIVPPGYEIAGYRGGLQLRTERLAGPFALREYESLVLTKRAADAKLATDFLQTANTLLQQGQQQRASEVLSRATKTNSLDEASNEDARVQLRALRTQQAVVGLNTRRQRLYLDNRADAQRNEQLEQAANLNPLMRGKLDFDPQQVDQLLMGNTAEENTALRGIAGRMVDQQLAAEPAPSAIDVTIPEHGRVITFGRSLQVDGDAPLELRLALARSGRGNLYWTIGLMAGLGGVAGLLRRRPATSR